MDACRAAAAILLFSISIACAAGWHVGDQVQAWNVTWYGATVAEVGTGTRAGYYLVRFERYATPQWVKAEYIRARAGAPSPVTGSTAPSGGASMPRLGRYVCMGYAGGRGKFRWYLQLSNNAYQQKTPDLPAGTYAFDAAAKRLDFTSGPYHRNNWIGLFSVERDGKSHKIVLRDRASEAKGPRVNEYSNIYCTLSSAG